jgi:cytochrome c556
MALSRLVSVALAGCAFTIGGMSVAGSVPPAVLTPEQIIAARQATLDMSVMTMAEMKGAVASGTDIKKQFYPAKTLARWARVLPTLFPQGTEQGATPAETHALPNVWTDRAGFEKAAANYAAAADKLEDLAKNGDSEGFSNQLAVVAKACDACHDNYKVK